jgi:aldehyde:ferredoxin oxidoreductase
MNSPDDYDTVMAEKRLRALNFERQRQMVADADKLLKLAKELNDEVAASNTGTLTPEQLHKIAEIEKLARSVKERMTAGSSQPQSVFPAPGFIYPTH